MAVALALAAAVPALPPLEDEFLVIARKMQLIKVDMKVPRRKGKLVLTRCRVTQPSGDPELDLIPCDVALGCMADDPATRKALALCVENRSQARLDAVIARHRAQRMVQP